MEYERLFVYFKHDHDRFGHLFTQQTTAKILAYDYSVHYDAHTCYSAYKLECADQFMEGGKHSERKFISMFHKLGLRATTWLNSVVSVIETMDYSIYVYHPAPPGPTGSTGG